MENSVKDFVNNYNQCISWNIDILNSLNKEYLLSHDYTKVIIREYLSMDTINDKDYDLEHAKVYTYEDTGLLELHVFSNKTYSNIYCWVNPNKNESEYKEERIKIINERLNERILELNKNLHTIMAEINQLTNFKNMFK